MCQRQFAAGRILCRMCLAPQSKLRDGLGHLSFTESSAWGHVTTDIEAETAQARASTIDMLVSSLDIQRVEFVKIDAEGSEWAILKGAADTVKRFQPLIRVRWKMKKILRLSPGRLVSRGPRKRARSGRARTNLAAICRCFPAVRRGREPGWRVIHVQSLRRYDAALDTKRTGATKNRLQT
jgi:hypothetical protein